MAEPDKKLFNLAVKAIKQVITLYVHNEIPKGTLSVLSHVNSIIKKTYPNASPISVSFDRLPGYSLASLSYDPKNGSIIHLPSSMTIDVYDGATSLVQHELQHYFDKIHGYPQYLRRKEVDVIKHGKHLGEIRAYARELYKVIPSKIKFNEKTLTTFISTVIVLSKDESFSRYFITTMGFNNEFKDILDIVIDQLIQEGRWAGERMSGYSFRELKRQVPVISHRILIKLNNILHKK